MNKFSLIFAITLFSCTQAINQNVQVQQTDKVIEQLIKQGIIQVPKSASQTATTNDNKNRSTPVLPSATTKPVNTTVSPSPSNPSPISPVVLYPSSANPTPSPSISNEPIQIISATWDQYSSKFIILANSVDYIPLNYSWQADSGSFSTPSGGTAQWSAGGRTGITTVMCTINDNKKNTKVVKFILSVRKRNEAYSATLTDTIYE